MKDKRFKKRRTKFDSQVLIIYVSLTKFDHKDKWWEIGQRKKKFEMEVKEK